MAIFGAWPLAILLGGVKTLLGWWLRQWERWWKRTIASKTEPSKTKKEELQKTLSDTLAEVQKYKRLVGLLGDEKKKLELKVDEMGASERGKVAMEMQYLRSEKEELLRQLELEQNKTEAAEKLNISSFKSQAGAENVLKIKECETVELKRQMKALVVEKTKMQIQLEGVKRKLSIEKNKNAAAEEELNSERAKVAKEIQAMQEEKKELDSVKDPMVSKLLHCKQCSAVFRCWNDWAQSKKCPICWTSNQ